MDEGRTGIDLAQVHRALGVLGLELDTVRDQLAAAEDLDAQLSEIAALAVESEAGVLLPRGDELDAALFELIDGLRQAGVNVSLGQTAAGPALVFGAPAVHAYEVSFDAEIDADALVRAVAPLLPDSHQILIALDYDAGDALPLVLLERAAYESLRAAVGGSAIDRVLARPQAESAGVHLLEVGLDNLLAPDFHQRFKARTPDAGSSTNLDAVSARVQRYDARIAWPEGQRRPPGDDFLELSSVLAGEPLAAALGSGDGKGDRGALANVLYQFALVTTVGAQWDVVAARQNPGMSAQCVLGLGQLTWSWFVFAALGAEAEAERAGHLLDHEWTRAQERGAVSVRQRAWFDLGAFLRGEARVPAIGRLRELLPLATRAGWEDPALVSAALAVHTEPRGDQLTHQPLYYLWPAPLYALARRASALDLLPRDNPFLSRALDLSLVDRNQALVKYIERQFARFDAMDEARLPPLLDPLPVIVDVRITEVDAKVAHGRTLLAAREDAEHHVVAPHGGRPMKAGEIWLFEVQGARQTRARARYEDLGEVSFQIALPTGEWLSPADPHS